MKKWVFSVRRWRLRKLGVTFANLTQTSHEHHEMWMWKPSYGLSALRAYPKRTRRHNSKYLSCFDCISATVCCFSRQCICLIANERQKKNASKLMKKKKKTENTRGLRQNEWNGHSSLVYANKIIQRRAMKEKDEIKKYISRARLLEMRQYALSQAICIERIWRWQMARRQLATTPSSYRTN